VVHDQIDLLAELFVDFGDDGLDGSDGIVGNQGGLFQGLPRQCLHGGLNRLAGPIGLGFEFFLKKPFELVDLNGLGFCRLLQWCPFLYLP
jgi:hypothetical protein